VRTSIRRGGVGIGGGVLEPLQAGLVIIGDGAIGARAPKSPRVSKSRGCCPPRWASISAPSTKIDRATGEVHIGQGAAPCRRRVKAPCPRFLPDGSPGPALLRQNRKIARRPHAWSKTGINAVARLTIAAPIRC
jgi:2,3,4,5-tetrahydropyridine-2-carboxylate N-succinyltransferase